MFGFFAETCKVYVHVSDRGQTFENDRIYLHWKI